MAQPTYRGTTDPVIHRQTIRSDPNRGTVIDTWYSCISASNLITLYNQFQFNGVSVEFTTEGGKVLLHANDATLNNPVDNWELIGDSERKDLFQNPEWTSKLAAGIFTSSMMPALRNFLSNNATAHGPGNVGGAFDPPAAGSLYSSLVPLSGTIIEDAYKRYLAGNDEFENDAYAGGYSLKHTTNVPARYTTNVADFNVGYIYSTANLLTEVSSLSLWAFPIPTRLYYKINLLGASVPNNPPWASSGLDPKYYTWGWKKSRSTEDTASNNRVNIVQHYTLELWSNDDYPVFV